ncbi:MAG: organic solvent tolerance protein OstA [Pirellulales bacterium]|nr:organic solvent tolerance protein OstA [Pirellulales bacterium]
MPARFRYAATRLRATGRGARRGWTPPARLRLAVPGAIALVVLAAAVGGAPAPAAGQVELPEPERDQPIQISAEAANRFTQGAYEVWLLRGNCRIGQGSARVQSREAVLWIDHAGGGERSPGKVIAYLEGDVSRAFAREGNATRLEDATWLGRFETTAEIRVHAARVAGEPDVQPAIYLRGLKRRHPTPAEAIRRTQFTASDAPVVQAGTRRIRVFPRSNAPVQVQWFPDPHSDQWVAVIDSGVNMIVDGIDTFVEGLGQLDSIDVSADRMVIWTRDAQEPDLSGQRLQGQQAPLEIYMEGNIAFRQFISGLGEQVIYAQRMYYDVANQRGTVIEAELLTPVPQYQGLLRLKAQVLQQLGRDRYFAQNGFLTSSRMGRPGYRIQSGNIQFEGIQRPLFDPLSGQPMIDGQTGQAMIGHQRQVTSQDNVLYLGDVPVFFWPTLSTDLEDPTFYIRGAQIKNDQVYGTQILTDWSAYELLGIRHAPAGTDWDFSLDYLGDRGFGHGTTFLYSRDHFFHLPGPAEGLIDYWGIQDHGSDDLGVDRRGLLPEKDYRFRLFGKHRQQLPDGFQWTGEVGWISDRNFLEEYYKREWDELKDQTTGLELKRIRENTSWSIAADVRPNEFFTQTEWLPRGDHFWLGQSVFRDAFTWFEHSQAGYGRFRVLEPSTVNPDPAFRFLPWEQRSAEGARLITRQEIDWPLQLGPVKVVPYALGELGHWGQDINHDDVQRAYWQTGLRASMPMWRADPLVENPLFNVHGLAHKVVFDVELAFAESNRDMDRFPLYDPLDDDSIEAFRRRLAQNTFGLPTVPEPFDPRSYALRTGLGGWVTSPAAEIADDLTTLRMGVRQRWQTKRGMPGNRRILDWVVLDTGMTWFPDEMRDDFGKSVGLLDYDFRWHVGDRLTLLSEGVFDFFPDGQHVMTIGGFLSRPPRGRLYLGLRLLEGPISSHILSLSYDYQMSPKWISTFGTSIDFKDEGNLGQRFAITRIGESLLISAGFTVDPARDNVGVSLAIEPRFLPKSRLGQMGGAQIPVAGVYGLE